ncbi:MAG: efflux RND transporter periplasmic adaptor subunit [Sediminibacterium sp.]|nr:efflux RND transporter periplasmic adaptor subunit [Sediminibacterium sp.]TXT33094.1 MAG: RND family efflux transporter MFP subunit [Chitinophagaceae bacterium]
MKKLFIISYLILIIVAVACNNNKDPHAAHKAEAAKEIYTCPMPEDSVFSNKPGSCPKCGMDLVKKETHSKPVVEVELETILKPTNEFVISSIPVTTMEKRGEQIEIEAVGNITYDTKQVGSISARISGRIEKLYVRYRYQKIKKGQKILDIYSPELLTAQQNLLFLLKNDAENTTFLQAAKEKLLLLGMSNEQLQQVIQSGKPSLTITVYSNYNGHIHESGGTMNTFAGTMKDISLITEELPFKEGMYIQKGQSFFTVYNPDRAWAILNIYGDNQSLVKVGNTVRVTPETAPDKDFRASIDFIEPFYRKESKTLTTRVYFNNSSLKIPIGSQVKATVFGNTREAYWLPKEAVLSLGLDKVVFIKSNGGFKAVKINTGIIHAKHIQILNGLSVTDSVATNAQYLMDSESFIKIKN